MTSQDVDQFHNLFTRCFSLHLMICKFALAVAIAAAKPWKQLLLYLWLKENDIQVFSDNYLYSNITWGFFNVYKIQKVTFKWTVSHTLAFPFSLALYVFPCWFKVIFCLRCSRLLKEGGTDSRDYSYGRTSNNWSSYTSSDLIEALKWWGERKRVKHYSISESLSRTLLLKGSQLWDKDTDHEGQGDTPREGVTDESEKWELLGTHTTSTHKYRKMRMRPRRTLISDCLIKGWKS